MLSKLKRVQRVSVGVCLEHKNTSFPPVQGLEVPCTSKKKKHSFIHKGTDLIDVDSDPWESPPATTAKPQKEDYAKEILQCYVAEGLAAGV